MDYKIDYYNVLKVTKTASKEDLKASYRQLAKLHHPDKNPDDPGAGERFRQVQDAYEVLSNDILRHLYDEYRATNAASAKQTTSSSGENKTSATSAPAPNSRTFTSTVKIWREKRIYVKGRINIKFQGMPEAVNAYMEGREHDYRIYPTETIVKIQSSALYKDGPTKEFERDWSSTELFAVPLAQPLRCQMMVAGADEWYELTIHELKITDPVIINVTKHEQNNFGELTGDCYGFIVHRYEEEVTETHTEYYGATGQVETKESAGVYFTRQQFYSKDGSDYWGEWSINASATERAKSTQSTTATKARNNPRQQYDGYWRYAGWIIYLFIGLLIWPKLIATLLIIIAVLLLFPLVGSFANRFAKFIPWLVVIIFISFLAIGIRSRFYPTPVIVRKTTTNYQPLNTRKQALNDNRHDTIISHLVQWNDYDSNQYRVELRILQSAVNNSHEAHRSMVLRNLPADGAAMVYGQLRKMDTGKLSYVYFAFDSIARSRSLNDKQAADMVVSCIQSIPYVLVVDQSCDAEYGDQFISSYLQNCQNDCCLGNVRFGVQSPAEFIGDLKGDCDTRALVLFDILSKMGYDVALLTSTVYKHALIAIHFKDNQSGKGISIPVNGNNYFLWETTSSGHQRGEIPSAISKLENWKISLIHQQ